MLTLKRHKAKLISGAVYDSHLLYRDGDSVYSFCTSEFTQITGIKLKPNETREITSIKITLKPVQTTKKRSRKKS